MTSRPWHILRWFGFLAIGLTITIGSGMRFRAKERQEEGSLDRHDSPDDSLVAQAPRPWMAPKPEDAIEAETLNVPPALAATGVVSEAATEYLAVATLDPTSPEAEQEIDAIVAALAEFAVDNGQFRSVEERGQRGFVFSCDVPTGDGFETFVGEGPDPPSAARHALSRIRRWAAAPGETVLR